MHGVTQEEAGSFCVLGLRVWVWGIWVWGFRVEDLGSIGSRL